VTRPLFEQYKDALRRGHLAARAGNLEEALAAYAEAARLAPDRAAPHTSSATVLHRSGRQPDALAAFERALAIAPDDEATLRARAVAFRELGRLASAAADLEHLAEALEADGHRPEALKAAREALALTANAARRALVDRLEQPEDESAPRPRPTPTASRIPTASLSGSPAVPPTSAQPTFPPLSAIRHAATAADGEAAPPAAQVPTGTAAQPPPAATEVPARNSPTLLELYDRPIQEAGSEPPAPAGTPGPAPATAPAPEAGPVAEEAAAPEPEPATVMAAEPELEPGSYVAPEAEPAPPSVPASESEPTPWRRQPTSAAAPPGALVPELAALNEATPGRVVLDPDIADFGFEPLIQLEDVDEGISIPWPAIDLPSAPPPPIVGPPPDPEVLMAEALSLIDGGDPKAARNLLLTAVAVHRAAGRPDAALDVCLQLLALAPGDAHVHLAIAGLQLDRGWRTLATEKIQLLLRLTSLTGDTQAEADAHALAAERLRDEPPSSFARA
jgi:tetratricopeptide (TPR) repeat protein